MSPLFIGPLDMPTDDQEVLMLTQGVHSGVFGLRIGSLLLASLVLVAGFIASPAQAQEMQPVGIVAGTVTDSTTGAPLPGVNVVIAGTQRGASTNAEGRFVISDLEPGTYALLASFIGYTTKRVEDVAVTAGDTTQVEIALSPTQVGLEEVVVVGYGTQEAENLTGAVSTVDAEAFDDRALTSAANALQGQVSGLTVITRSGEPGDDTGTLRIRGLGTFGNNSPLVLVDGIPSSLDAVPPSDIENITVLKDAAAAAIYGVRAANGVILVTTKRGPREGITFSYSGYVGAQTPTRLPDFLGSAGYARLYNEALANEGKKPIYSQKEISKFASGAYPNQYPSTDWFDALLKDYALQQSHYVSLAGGLDATRYRVSFRYLNQDGLIPTLEVNEYNLRVNLDTDVNERLHLSMSLAGTRELEDRPYKSSSGFFADALALPPTVPVRYTDGTWGYWKAGRNPVRQAREDGYDRQKATRLRGSAMVEYELLDGLHLRGRAGIDTYSGLNESFRKQLTYYDFETGDVAYVTTPTQLTNWDGYNQSITLEAFLNYKKIFGDHYVEGLLGYSQQDYRSDWFEASREDFPNNSLHELDAGDPTTEQNNGSAEAWAIRSVFGRVNYSFLDRYLFEVNLRYDGSSRFPEEKRYGLFPSFSAGWRLSEEPFFDGIDVISNLKVRGSWGRLGNDDVGLYPFWTTYSLGANYTFGNQLVSGITESRLPNRRITWETTTVTDVGLDVGLFDGQLDLTVDYFYKMTDDILLTLPIPQSVGIGAPPQNAASVLNRGWEFSGTYRDNLGALGFTLSGNLSFIHNEVTDLAGTGPYIDDFTIQDVGLPMLSLYGYEAVGFFQSEEAVENHAFQDPFTRPGDIIYKDQNGDGEINAEDRVYLGSYFPGITYAATFAANYKGFDLRVFLQGVSRVKGYLRNEAAAAFFNGSKVLEWHQDRWTPDNRDASYPRLTLSRDHNLRPSSFWMRDASYLRIKNIQFGYTLPTSLLEPYGVSRLRLYVNADNLYTFTSFRGFDPEAPVGRGRYYPQVTTYTFGINMSF